MGRYTPPKIGGRYGRLIVRRITGLSYREKRCICVCDCGARTLVMPLKLVQGVTQSCGCKAKENRAKANTLHGFTGTRTYYVWKSMRQRCENPTNKDYADYGARGIVVHPTWANFPTFLRDMGEKPEGLTLERIRNDEGYSPDNCVWATRKQQANNRRERRV